MSENFQDKRPFPKLKLNSPTAKGKKSNQFSRKGLGIYFFFSLLVTALVGYFLVREIQLNATKKLIQDCEGQKNCPGRIEALEKLVKAKRSLISVDLSQARLYFAQLSGAQLQAANLSSAQLSSAHLDSADLSSAQLSDAQLNLTNLTHAQLAYANLERADLSSASLYLANLTHAQLNYARLNYAQLNYADLHDASLDSADLNYADLEHTNLEHTDLYHANFDSANLEYADLHDADLDSADFNLANFAHVNLEQANLYHANLIEVHNLTPSQIKSACYWETAIFRGEFDNEQKTWLVNEKLNQQYIEQLKEDRASNPQHLIACHTKSDFENPLLN